MSTSTSTTTTTTTAPTVPHTTSNSPKPPSRVLTSLQQTGYVVIPGAFPPDSIDTLRAAASRVAALARSGRWPHLRTVPKQFPPWPSPDPLTHQLPPDARGIWGVQHLLHPDLGADADVFAACYFSERILGPVRELLGLPSADADAGEGEGDGRLVMELFNMLVAPDADFQLRWHRDGVPFGVSQAEEAELLGLTGSAAAVANGGEDEDVGGQGKQRRAFHAQYNMPLYEDASLELVPASHLRSRTDEEVRLLRDDPCAPELPGMMAVHLRPGDVVFYDNNVIHRGVYKAGVPRMTLHGSVGDAEGGTGRARNVLQHGVGEWVGSCDFRGLRELSGGDGGIGERAERMRRRLMDLGREAGEDGKGFVFDD